MSNTKVFLFAVLFLAAFCIAAYVFVVGPTVAAVGFIF